MQRRLRDQRVQRAFRRGVERQAAGHLGPGGGAHRGEVGDLQAGLRVHGPVHQGRIPRQPPVAAIHRQVGEAHGAARLHNRLRAQADVAAEHAVGGRSGLQTAQRAAETGRQRAVLLPAHRPGQGQRPGQRLPGEGGEARQIIGVQRHRHVGGLAPAGHAALRPGAGRRGGQGHPLDPHRSGVGVDPRPPVQPHLRPGDRGQGGVIGGEVVDQPLHHNGQRVQRALGGARHGALPPGDTGGEAVQGGVRPGLNLVAQVEAAAVGADASGKIGRGGGGLDGHRLQGQGTVRSDHHRALERRLRPGQRRDVGAEKGRHVAGRRDGDGVPFRHRLDRRVGGQPGGVLRRRGEGALPVVQRALPVQRRVDRGGAGDVQRGGDQPARRFRRLQIQVEPLVVGVEGDVQRHRARLFAQPVHVQVRLQRRSARREVERPVDLQPRLLPDQRLRQDQLGDGQLVHGDAHRQTGQQGGRSLVGRRLRPLGGQRRALHDDALRLDGVGLGPPGQQRGRGEVDAQILQPQPHALAVGDGDVRDREVDGHRAADGADPDLKVRTVDRLLDGLGDPAPDGVGRTPAAPVGVGRAGGLRQDRPAEDSDGQKKDDQTTQNRHHAPRCGIPRMV